MKEVHDAAAITHTIPATIRDRERSMRPPRAGALCRRTRRTAYPFGAYSIVWGGSDESADRRLIGDGIYFERDCSIPFSGAVDA